MVDKKHFSSLSTFNLLRTIFEQQDHIALQEKQIEVLEQKLTEVLHRLQAYENAHTPSSKQRKKNTDRDPKKPRFPGKPSGSNGGGIVLPPPDVVVKHTLDKDPESGKPLGKPVGFRSQIVIDFPDKPLVVTEHRIMQYQLSSGEIIEPNVKLPNGTYGPNLKSIVVMVRALNLSCAKIALLLQELGAPSFSATTVKDICAESATKLQPQREKFLKTLRKAPHLHADETSMRQDGKNGYVWGFFSKVIGIFEATLSRGRTVPQQLLADYLGVLVSDGYVVYDVFPVRQRCWVHLLREFKEYKDHDEITVQYTRLQLLYEQLKNLPRPTPDAQQAQVKATFIDIITCLKTIKGARKLTVLLENGGDEWFTALKYEDVPFDNNHAERGLRPLVLWRKTIGCYRNQKGIDWINNTLSVLYTWKLQEQNIYQNLRTLNWN
jgi:hypothetical protein